MNEQHEALLAVETINGELWEDPRIQPIIDQHGHLLTFASDGNSCDICLGPIQLWQSNDDPRPSWTSRGKSC